MASAASGRPIKRKIVSEEDMIANLERANLQKAVKGVILGYYRAAQAGEFAIVDPTLERLLGQKPRPMQDVVRRHLG